MKEQDAGLSKTLHWAELRREFAHGSVLTRKQVFSFYQRLDPAVKQTTLDWRIYELVSRGLLTVPKRGHYRLADEAPAAHPYRPELSTAQRNIWRTLLGQVQVPMGCLWSTSWVNEFSRHQTARNFLLVEVPRDYMQTVFYALKDRHSYRVFLRPDPQLLTYYVSETDRPIIVSPFVSRAPVQEMSKVPVPRLEKLLVDLFSSPNLFAAYQGRELETIFTNARRLYALDERTLFSYAKRRHKASDLQRFLQRLPDWPFPSELV